MEADITVIKKSLVIVWLFVLFTAISYLFWHNEYVYSLPTKVPSNYVAVKLGEKININERIFSLKGRPSFIHFFNPECPCSRFNIPHFRSLVHQYSSRVAFTIVVLNNDKSFTRKDIQDEFGLDIPVSFDSSIAAKCGVYAAPQAVILDTGFVLCYRGNYNKGRYCTDSGSDFAKITLDSIVNNNKVPSFGPVATTAYGCQFSTCKQ